VEPERWAQVKWILSACLELDPGERASYVAQSCDGNPALMADVQNMLASNAELGDFLEKPVLGDRSEEILTGRQIGNYLLRELIAEGGMGNVYRAVRVTDFQKNVAIKLVKRGMDSEFILRRFRHERQMLAGLDHHNVARLLDGGATADGRPYLVMEYIEGKPITEYAERLAIREQLELFRTVCLAVQYAHQNLVVHRDLKPGNILVTADGTPKLLDFGIAKLLEPDADASVTLVRLMTPECASPEQVRGEPITTATDIYSLGVLLYQLITGRRPYEFRVHTPEEARRVVCETEPKRPGVSEDLDNIVLKAMHKDPARRYVSAEQLAEDIRRHLANLPVRARKDTIAYRASKFASRHKVGVAAVSTAAVILTAGMIVTVREGRIAQRRFNDLRQLANSLIFDIHDSIRDLPGSTPARKLIVDRALRYLDSLSRESRGDVSLQRELAEAYERVGRVQGSYLESNLGDSRASLASHLRALGIRQQIAATSSDWNDRLALARAYRRAGRQQWAAGDYTGGMKHLDEAIRTAEALNRAHPNNWDILQELGSDYHSSGVIQTPSYSGGPADAAKAGEAYRRSVAIWEAMLRIKPDDLATLYTYASALAGLGVCLEDVEPEAALRFYIRNLEIEQKLHKLSPDMNYARGVALAYDEIANLEVKTGDFSHAVENNQRALNIYRELFQVDPKNAALQQSLATAYANSASLSANAGKTAPVLEYAEKGLEIMRHVVASDPRNSEQRGVLAALSASNGSSLMKVGKSERALEYFDEARSIYESLDRAAKSVRSSANAAACREKMGEAAARAGDWDRASQYIQEALNAVESSLSGQNPDLSALYTAADSYQSLGDMEVSQARRSRQNRARRKECLTRAQAWYLKSVGVWRRIEHPGHVTPSGVDSGDISTVQKSLDRCQAALSVLEPVPKQ